MFLKKRKQQINIGEVELHKRVLEGNVKKLITVLAIGLSLFQLGTAVFGVYKTAVVHRAVHLAVVLFLFFIIYPGKKKTTHEKLWFRIDMLIATASLIVVGYVVFFYDNIAERIGNLEPLTQIDLIIGLLMIIFVLEATRRSNKVFFVMMLFAISYMIWGPYFPGMFAHPGISAERLLYLLAYSTEGIFGTGLSVSSTYLYLFILFGIFLGKTGVTDFFMKFALSIVGKFKGGSAKACIIGSSLMGMVTGSSIGNAVAVGAFTIPLMKKTGFKSHVAGAVEAIASCGGQLMPPVMGAAAFIMAEMTGIPYGKIALGAVIPAAIYYINIFSVIHFEASKLGLQGMTKDELPKFKEVVLSSWHLFIPLFVLVYLLMVASFTATKAGAVAIFSCIIVTYIRKGKRFNFKDFLEVCEKGAYSAVEIAVLCAGIGIIISSITLTGLGMRFSTIAMALTGQQLIPILIMAMVVSLILGMGMPTPVVYLLMAMFAAPSIVKMGVPVLSAHLFVFYYAILSGLTPPVCIVSIVSAGIAQANWLQTGITSTRFALAAFIIPFMWIFGPELLMEGAPLDIALSFIFACIGSISIAACVQGWFITKANIFERIMLFAAGILMVKTGLASDMIGLLLLIVVLINQYRKRTKTSEVYKVEVDMGS
ncbi:MAG: TRAP transporter permease [Sedimentibacter sp.]